MIKELEKHLWHYTILLLIILIGGLVFLAYPDKITKFQAGALTAVAYIFWGIFHHLWEKSLNLKIVVEYSLIGLLAIVLLGGVLL